jgi:hypothetical protein
MVGRTARNTIATCRISAAIPLSVRDPGRIFPLQMICMKCRTRPGPAVARRTIATACMPARSGAGLETRRSYSQLAALVPAWRVVALGEAAPLSAPTQV